MFVYKILMTFIKTIYFNFRCFDLKNAIIMPVIVSYKVKLIGIKRGCILIKTSDKKRFMIKIGFNGSFFVSNATSSLCIRENGKMVFNGNAVFGEGINIFLNGGVLDIGNNFYANRNLLIQCEKKIKIGNDCLIGWNVSIRDTNGNHTVIKNGIENNNKGEIVLKNHVWIASDVLILSNTMVGNDNIIATRSMVKGLKSDCNKLIAGSPASIKEGTYAWEN